MGLLIDSPIMAKQFLEEVCRSLQKLTYKVELDEGGHLQWLATIDGDEIVETREPLTGWWRHLLARMYRVLPGGQLWQKWPAEYLDD